MSLRRHFVPTAWLLCGLPLSLSFRMNATLACNDTQSRKLKVPNLNSAALCSEMEPRSESRNASLARTAPSVEMSQVGHHGGPQQKANWQKPAGKTTARACPAPVPPAYPPSQWAPLIPYRKVTIRTKRGKQFVAAVNPGAVPHSREQSSGSDFSGKQRHYARPHVAVAR